MEEYELLRIIIAICVVIVVDIMFASGEIMKNIIARYNNFTKIKKRIAKAITLFIAFVVFFQALEYFTGMNFFERIRNSFSSTGNNCKSMLVIICWLF